MVNGSTVTLLPTVTCLGVIVDQEMLFADHVRRLASLCFYWLYKAAAFDQTDPDDGNHDDSGVRLGY